MSVAAVGAPMEVTAIPVGQTAIKVKWLQSVSESIMFYQITSIIANDTQEHRLPPYLISPDVATIEGQTSEHYLIDLKPNTRYAIWVEALTADEVSPPSDVVFQMTNS